MIKLREMLVPDYVFHVTLKNNLPSIKTQGLIPKVPTDFEGEEKAVYLFNSKENAEQAILNWLGDRYEDEVELILLTISTKGLNIIPTHDSEEFPLEWELKSYNMIPWKNVTKIDNI